MQSIFVLSEETIQQIMSGDLKNALYSQLKPKTQLIEYTYSDQDVVVEPRSAK